MSQTEKQFERLPSDVLPVNYKVELQPDLNAFTFKGKLEITAKVPHPLSWNAQYCMHTSLIHLRQLKAVMGCVNGHISG